MGVKITQEVEVLRPTTTPLTSSILDHAHVGPDMTDFGMRNNAGLYPSYNCIVMNATTPECPEPAVDGQGKRVVKDFGFGGWVPAAEGVVYAGVQCSNVGLDREDMLSEAKRIFALNEGKGVERLLVADRFVDDAENNYWDAPVDIGTPVLSGLAGIAEGLAMLESYAATVYAGVPTLHLPRFAVSMLNERIVWKGNKAYTVLGSKVACGGGYDDPDNYADNGTITMYATGEVYVEKSTEFDALAFVHPGDGLRTNLNATQDPNQFTDNSSLVLVERMFRVAVDCFVASVEVNVAGGN